MYIFSIYELIEAGYLYFHRPVISCNRIAWFRNITLHDYMICVHVERNKDESQMKRPDAWQ